MADDDQGGLWLSIADLARDRGISRQGAAKRVERLAGQGLLTTRAGPRGTRLVNLAEFDRVSGETVDAVRAANGRHEISPADPVLAREQARRAGYDADLKRLDLLERLGKLVPVDDLAELATEFGATVLRVLDGLPARADDLASRIGRDGVAGARAFLKELREDLRNRFADGFATLAATAAADRARSLDDVKLPGEA